MFYRDDLRSSGHEAVARTVSASRKLHSFLRNEGREQLVESGATDVHWSRMVAMSVCGQIAAFVLLFKGIGYGLDLVAAESGDRARW